MKDVHFGQIHTIRVDGGYYDGRRQDRFSTDRGSGLPVAEFMLCTLI